MVHLPAPLGASLALAPLAGIDPERRAEGGPGVPGGGLHPDAAEWATVAQARVHHAVQRHAARHAEIVAAGRFVQPAHQRQRRLL
jgi:hypothetical protein